jgi:DNA replication protein DnaC
MPTETVCAKCGGTGWIIVERADVSAAEACTCRNDGRASRLEERAQIPPLYRHASFENFIVPGPDNPSGRTAMVNTLLAVKTFARDFPNENQPGLLLVGAQGTGKTHLAVAAMRKIVEKGFECLFWDYQTLLNSIRSSYDVTSNLSNRDAYRAALDTEVLLLDDLGAQRVTDWVEDTVTSIITHRCNNRRPLIATTNLPDPDAGSTVIQRSVTGTPEYRKTLADHIGARARSRLFEMCKVILMPGGDYRLPKQRMF